MIGKKVCGVISGTKIHSAKKSDFQILPFKVDIVQEKLVGIEYNGCVGSDFDVVKSPPILIDVQIHSIKMQIGDKLIADYE